jgi:molecular chaperone GrpE
MSNDAKGQSPVHDAPVVNQSDLDRDVPTTELTQAEASPGSTDVLAGLDQIKAMLMERTEQILSVFQQSLAYDRFKETQIDQLHGELQAYKSDLVGKITMPFVNGIIRLHDDIGKLVESARKESSSELPSQYFEKVLTGLQEDIEILLGDQDINVYREEGELYNPHRQRVLRSMPAIDPSQVGRIVERLRPGFERRGQIVMKERVSVYTSALGGVPVQSEPSTPPPSSPAP